MEGSDADGSMSKMVVGSGVGNAGIKRKHKGKYHCKHGVVSYTARYPLQVPLARSMSKSYT